MSDPGRGRGGRGRRGDQSSGRGGKSFSDNRPASKRQLSDYVCCLGSARQASGHETTTECLVNCVKGDFESGEDIGPPLKRLEESDVSVCKPDLRNSAHQDPGIEGAQDRQHEIESKAESDAHMGREQTYEDNISRAYAPLWGQCAKSMQSKTQAREDFGSGVGGSPVSPLKATQQHALDCQERRYEMSIILDAIKTTVNLKQRDNESLQGHTRRFKTARDVSVSHLGGPIDLRKCVQTMAEFDEDDKDRVERCEERASQQLMASTCLEDSDSSKCGALISGLKTQQSLGDNQCPMTVTEADNILSSHRSDSPCKPQKREAEEGGEESPTLSFSQSGGKCHCCGKAGHMSPRVN